MWMQTGLPRGKVICTWNEWSARTYMLIHYNALGKCAMQHYCIHYILYNGHRCFLSVLFHLHSFLSLLKSGITGHRNMPTSRWVWKCRQIKQCHFWPRALNFLCSSFFFLPPPAAAFWKLTDQATFFFRQCNFNWDCVRIVVMATALGLAWHPSPMNWA